MSDESTTGTPSGPARPVPPIPPVPPAQPVAPEQPVALEPPVPPAASRARRANVLKAVAVVAAAAVLGTYCYTVVRNKQHDRDGARPAATWTAPTPSATKAFGAKSGGSHYGSLSLLLLPVPDDYGPGPDVEAYGNDVVLTAGQASALVKGDAGAKTAKERKQLDAAVDALHIEGAGLRTYAHHSHELIVQTALIQMRNKRAAQAESAYFGTFAKALGGYGKGLKVPGHPQATCVLPKRDTGEKLDSMICLATEGDLMVEMNAEGVAPLEQSAAVDLLRRQLDRIQDPGESV